MHVPLMDEPAVYGERIWFICTKNAGFYDSDKASIY